MGQSEDILTFFNSDAFSNLITPVLNACGIVLNEISRIFENVDADVLEEYLHLQRWEEWWKNAKSVIDDLGIQELRVCMAHYACDKRITERVQYAYMRVRMIEFIGWQRGFEENKFELNDMEILL